MAGERLVGSSGKALLRMAKNILVISCDIAETRVALIENGIIAELHIERRGAHARGRHVGDIYLGKVTRVLPGPAGRLHRHRPRARGVPPRRGPHPARRLRDVPRGRAQARARAPGTGAQRAGDADRRRPAPTARAAVAEVEEAAADGRGRGRRGRRRGRGRGDEAAADAAAEVEEAAAEDAEDDRTPTRRRTTEDGAEARESASDVDEPRAASPRQTTASDDERERRRVRGDAPSSRSTRARRRPPASTIPTASRRRARGRGRSTICSTTRTSPASPSAIPGAPTPRAPAPQLDERATAAAATVDAGADGAGTRARRRSRGAQRGRRRRRGGARASARRRPRSPARAPGGGVPGRLSKSTPIRDVVKEGQEIIVQITKEPIGTKGARCSSHISLPGRYVVYLPTLEHVGISKRIGSDKERARLRETIESMKPPTRRAHRAHGRRGAHEEAAEAGRRLPRPPLGRGREEARGREGPGARCSSELDIVLKTARDLFTDDVDQIVIDDKAQYERAVPLRRDVHARAAEGHRLLRRRRADLRRVRHRGRDRARPVAQGAAAERRLPHHRRGRGPHRDRRQHRSVRRQGLKDMEETILKTNLEAVQEIAYQLRFRNIGGLIILDLIDMEKAVEPREGPARRSRSSCRRTRPRRRSTASRSSASSR